MDEMRNTNGHQRYVNYPSRLFHLRPQSNLRMTDDLDWEKAFLWQKVSRPFCEADWIQEFPCPALDRPLDQFPEAILKRGLSMRISKSTTREALDFAAAVLKAPARDPSEPAPAPDVPWRNVKTMAIDIIGQLEKKGNRRAVALAVKVREHQRARDDYHSFFRFRDADRKPTGMGFCGTRDVFLLDDEYLTDFLRRAGQRGALNRRKRSDVKLVSFLTSGDAAKVTTVAVSARAFHDPRARTYLCYAVVRTFPNLQRLLLTSIGVADRDPSRPRSNPSQYGRLGEMEHLAEREVRDNGGSSFLARCREDPAARFDIANMSPKLIKATGAYADGRGRVLAGEEARTPVVAYGLGAGLLHDPSAQSQGDKAAADPPLVEAVQYVLSAAFSVFSRQREAAARATRLETLSKLEGRRTRLPRPVHRGPRGSPQPAARLYRRTEVTPENLWEWAREAYAKQQRRAVPDDEASETDPDSEASLPAAEVGPADREYALVEAVVLVYDRDAFDGNVRSGWAGFGPGVELSHFGAVVG